MKNFFDNDFSGDILYSAKDYIQSGLKSKQIIKQLLEDYNESYDLYDAILTYGAIYYIDNYLKVGNIFIKRKIREIELELEELTHHYDTNGDIYFISKMKTLLGQVFVNNVYANNLLSEKVNVVKSQSFQNWDTFKILSTEIHLPIGYELLFTYHKDIMSSIQLDDVKYGYLWLNESNKSRSHNPKYFLHTVITLEQLHRRLISEGRTFNDLSIEMNQNDSINVFGFGISIDELLSKGIVEFIDNIELELPQNAITMRCLKMVRPSYVSEFLIQNINRIFSTFQSEIDDVIVSKGLY